ncbi:hypothetical protein Mlab_0468 [Methanocorpusculum labreanum Z]|uniref:Uncharacterized protein n=2 Tax=Methanocorpusculum labreanum TaxID=83984 RepID=A2SQN6_METLZ|nr:hypothetical protein Mlab_0468 [Methanocorpusculum labreanum Z]
MKRAACQHIFLMAQPLSEDAIFTCGRKLLIAEGKISFTISSDGIEVKFPTTRKISTELDVPHYYVLPYFAGLEANGYLTRTERVGIFTTPAGSRRLFTGISDEEQAQVEKILGRKIMDALFETEV